MKNTKHAQTRAQQRGVNKITQMILEAEGMERNQSGGISSLEMPSCQSTVNKLQHDIRNLIKQLKGLQKKLDSKDPLYEIISETSEVITVAHSFGRILDTGYGQGGRP